jgi:hypothetical protein
LEDGKLGIQEGDGDNNSFSLGTGQWTQSLSGKKNKKKKEKKIFGRLLFLFMFIQNSITKFYED